LARTISDLPNIHARHDGRPTVMTAFISSSSGPYARNARPCLVRGEFGRCTLVAAFAPVAGTAHGYDDVMRRREQLNPQSHMVTRVGEHCAGFRNGFVGRRDDVPLQLVSPRKALNCAGKVVAACHSPDACAAWVSAILRIFPRSVAAG
jgi:hypothetical protein